MIAWLRIGNHMEALQAHDLLWGMTTQTLENSAPAWAIEALQAGHPVVVRRAITDSSMVAIGIRGSARHQRYATQMPKSAVIRCVNPEQLVNVDLRLFLHLQQRLVGISKVMNRFAVQWGYTGSVGFELATGIQTVHVQSDIDLIMRMPNYLDKQLAHQMLIQLEETTEKVDVQLQTPHGGVALKEWARGSSKVLLKSSHAAVLVENPWQEKEFI